MKLRCLFFFLFLLSLPSHAQLQYGLTAGLNIDQVHLSDGEYKGYVNRQRSGFLIGPTFLYRIPKTGLSFDVSAFYDNRGARSTKPNEYKQINLSSLQFPVNIRYGIDFGDMVYGFLFTGVQYGLSLGGSNHFIVSGIGKNTGHVLDRQWTAQRSMVSMNFGIGGVVLEKVQVRVSYNLALRKTGEIQQRDQITGSVKTLTEGRVHACQIALSYIFWFLWIRAIRIRKTNVLYVQFR